MCINNLHQLPLPFLQAIDIHLGHCLTRQDQCTRSVRAVCAHCAIFAKLYVPITQDIAAGVDNLRVGRLEFLEFCIVRSLSWMGWEKKPSRIEEENIKKNRKNQHFSIKFEMCLSDNKGFVNLSYLEASCRDALYQFILSRSIVSRCTVSICFVSRCTVSMYLVYTLSRSTSDSWILFLALWNSISDIMVLKLNFSLVELNFRRMIFIFIHI